MQILFQIRLFIIFSAVGGVSRYQMRVDLNFTDRSLGVDGKTKLALIRFHSFTEPIIVHLTIGRQSLLRVIEKLYDLHVLLKSTV